MDKQKVTFWIFLISTFISLFIWPIIAIWSYLGRGLSAIGEYLVGKYTIGFLFSFMTIKTFWFITIPILIIILTATYFVFKKYEIEKLRLYMLWACLLFIDMLINISMIVFGNFN